MLGKVRNQSVTVLERRVGKECSDKLGHGVLRLKINAVFSKQPISWLAVISAIRADSTVKVCHADKQIAIVVLLDCDAKHSVLQ